MSKIAIIDDNADQSETLKTALDEYLSINESDLEVIVQFPFKNTDEYFNFIDKQEICVLLLDEKLNNQSSGENGPVDYRGNQLVTIIRERLKDFPVFSISTFAEDEELKEKFSEFEYIIPRQVFFEEGKKYVPIIIRAAQRYLDTNIKELDEFSKLTREIAQGNTETEKIRRLNALQVKLELPFTGFDDRLNWLDEYENHIKDLETFRKKIEEKMSKK